MDSHTPRSRPLTYCHLQRKSSSVKNLWCIANFTVLSYMRQDITEGTVPLTYHVESRRPRPCCLYLQCHNLPCRGQQIVTYKNLVPYQIVFWLVDLKRIAFLSDSPLTLGSNLSSGSVIWSWHFLPCLNRLSPHIPTSSYIPKNTLVGFFQDFKSETTNLLKWRASSSVLICAL